MANEQATLIKGEDKKIVDVNSPDAQKAFGEGFTLPEATTTATETLKTTPTEPQIFNREELLGKIDKSFTDFGGDAGANEQFIQGVAKLKGRDATPEEIAKGGTLSQVISDFGVGGELSGFALESPKEDITPKGGVADTTVDEPKKSVFDEIRAIRGAGVVAGAVDAAGVGTANQELTQAALNVEDIRNRIIEQQNIDEDALIDLEGQGRGITSGLIGSQQADMTVQQQRDLRDLKQDYNNALIIQSIKQGAFTRAENISREIAQDARQDIEDEVTLLLEENRIDEAQAKLLREEADTEFDRQADGFIRLTPQEASAFKQDELIQVGDKIYKRPVGGAGDQFTLSAGQTRFDEAGNIVAIGTSGGDVETRTVGNQIVKINPDGTTDVIFQGQETDDPFTVQQKFSNTLAFRTKFLAESKEFKDVQNAYNRVKASVKNPSAAGDLSLIFNYMKMLDPNSVVRESEFATAAASGSLGERFIAAGNKLLSGERLSEVMRKDFTDRSNSLFDAQKNTQVIRQKENRSTAGALGIDSELGVPDLIETQPTFNTIDDFLLNASEDQLQSAENIRNQFDVDDNDLLDLINEQISESLTFNNVGSDTKQATGNLPQRNNNPGNVKSGGIADKYAKKDSDGKPLTDNQGHLIFPSSNAGLSGLRDDLRAKTTGRSRVVTQKDPTIAQIGKAFAEDPNWANGVARILGATADTKASQLNFDNLVMAVATQEGFFA